MATTCQMPIAGLHQEPYQTRLGDFLASQLRRFAPSATLPATHGSSSTSLQSLAPSPPTARLGDNNMSFGPRAVARPRSPPSLSSSGLAAARPSPPRSDRPNHTKNASKHTRIQDAEPSHPSPRYQTESQATPFTAPSLSMSSRQGYSDSASDSADTDDGGFHRIGSQHFPPLLPTVGSQIAISRNRKAITAKIRDQVARFERQDSTPSVSSDASSLAAAAEPSREDEMQNLWVLFKKKRQLVEASRWEMGRQRKKLRELRRQKDEADNTFMGLLRPLLAKDQLGGFLISNDLLEARFNTMQALRTEYHSTESAYEGLEVALDKDEEELNRLEIRFFTLLASGQSHGSNTVQQSRATTDGAGSIGVLPYALSGISPDGPTVEMHPLWLELLDLLGDMNNAQEELDDVQFLKEDLEYKLGIKERTDLLITEDELQNMRELPADEQVKRERLQSVTEEVHRLRDLCIKLGVDEKDPPFHVAYALGMDTVEEIILDEPSSEATQTLAHDRYPWLLSQPDYILRPEPLTALSNLKQAINLGPEDINKPGRMRLAIKEYDISELLRKSNETDKTDFINRWLLQCLRTSPHQVDILANTFVQSTRLQIVDTQRWELDVLFYWGKDDAAVQSVELIAQLAFTVGTTRSSSGPERRSRSRVFSASSQTKGPASEPPDDHPWPDDIWEPQRAGSRRLGSEAASDIIRVRFWHDRYDGKPG